MPSVINTGTADRRRTYPKQLRSVDAFGRRPDLLERSLGYYHVPSMG